MSTHVLNELRQILNEVAAQRGKKKREKIGDETPILTEVVARSVLGEVVLFFDAREGREYYDDAIEELNRNGDKLINFLVDHANAVYMNNDSFAKAVNKDSGRDYLQGFMRHWLDGEFVKKYKNIAALLPRNWGWTNKGLDEYPNR